MPFPYQCIQARNSGEREAAGWTLFGACGSRLVVQSSGGSNFVWPSGKNNVSEEKETEDDTQERPEKRIKLSHPPEIKSNFCCLSLSNDKQHIVAATAEDKCIRVFKIEPDCRLSELSQRCMPRRPCAIAITSDDSTILCADKFGDVYALPLFPSLEEERSSTPNSGHNEATTEKPYVPAASMLTVHSGRNRKVLEDQMKQANLGKKKTKEPMQFKHELLLGHVSMLTDIAYTTIDAGVEGGKPRSFILTADRDEHIRISRGPSQAYIIEGFCQGHEEFISRLCLTGSGLLVSGGGDDYIYVWDWLNSRLIEKLCIRDTVIQFARTNPELAASLLADEASFKIAVSGIWSVPHDQPKVRSSTDIVYMRLSNHLQGDEILVACEGIPGLFRFGIGGTPGGSAVGEAISLDGNALGVVFVCPTTGACTAVVSVDNLHKPGSTTEVREQEGPFRLQYFSYQGDHWEADTVVGGKLNWFSSRALADTASVANGQDAGSDMTVETEKARRAADEKAVRDILYGIANLRKRPGTED
ncbi:guanine-N(7)--methyltransferase subunit TRM82 [Clohesyomyces aquaticus]|uniref:Guanine-N(7)--methyltransferase subunit TRM82 n=1 Tax=Clohesyomyces aquaticus TaxID=1231657 RepID=A0A1Y1ZWM7_9PLEO|nr:guanine-N(7)--methyltransferase subunit TRM82 [Clohesyomyces aquaticus]